MTCRSSIASSKRRLSLGPGAIDLVHQQHIGEHRTGTKHELPLLGVVGVHPGDVGGHQVRRALHSFEHTPQRGRQRLAEQGLAQARRTLQQHVTASDDSNRQRTDHRLQAEHHRAQLLLQALFEGDESVHFFLSGRIDYLKRRAQSYQQVVKLRQIDALSLYLGVQALAGARHPAPTRPSARSTNPTSVIRPRAGRKRLRASLKKFAIIC